LVNVCNEVDDNCDGVVDEDAVDRDVCFRDRDEDGFGAGQPYRGCCDSQLRFPDDCDDHDPSVNPDQLELAGDGLDNDCDAHTTDEDLDGDGVANDEDCAPTDPWSSTLYVDADGDGYGDPDVALVDCEEGVEDNTDCDDTRASTHPAAAEVADDGLDNDCDPGTTDYDIDGDGIDNDLDCGPSDPWSQQFYADADLDGFGDPGVVDCGLGGVADNTDCDDSDAEVFPGAEDICYNAIDDDCNGWVDDSEELRWCYPDYDGDGYGGAPGYSGCCPQTLSDAYDCDDTSPLVNPDILEVADDGVDNDCDSLTTDDDIDGDGVFDEDDCFPSDSEAWAMFADADGDGFGDPDVVDCGPDGVADDTDCDDGDPYIHPGIAYSCP